MFLVQTGLALVTVLGSCFCIISHFFFQPAPESLPSRFHGGDWGQKRGTPARSFGGFEKPVMNEQHTLKTTARLHHRKESGDEAVSIMGYATTVQSLLNNTRSFLLQKKSSNKAEQIYGAQNFERRRIDVRLRNFKCIFLLH